MKKKQHNFISWTMLALAAILLMNSLCCLSVKAQTCCDEHSAYKGDKSAYYLDEEFIYYQERPKEAKNKTEALACHMATSSEGKNGNEPKSKSSVNDIPENALDYMRPLVTAQVNYLRSSIFDSKTSFYKTTCKDKDVFWDTYLYYCGANVLNENKILNEDGGKVILRSNEIVDMGFALFNDYGGDIPDIDSHEKSGLINYDASTGKYLFESISDHSLIYKGRTIPQIDDDSNIRVTYLYQESFFGDREAPGQMAYDVVFRFNKRVNSSSTTPYYYTIVSVKQLENWDEEELSLAKVDIADYISKPDSLVSVLNLQSITPGEVNGGVKNGGYNIYDIHEIDVSEFSISEYENNFLSYRTCLNRSEFYNSGDPDVVVFDVGKGDSIYDVEDVLTDNKWDYFYEDSEYDHIVAYQKSIDDKDYILSFKFSGEECIEWKILSYSPENTDTEEELLKKWFNIPSDTDINDYGVSSPMYWAAGTKWLSPVGITLEDGSRGGAYCDSITFAPEKNITPFY